MSRAVPLAVVLSCVVALVGCDHEQEQGPSEEVDAGNTQEEPTTPAPKLRANAPLAPATIIVGSGAQQLTVHGEDFVAASVVRWGGADRPTTFVDASTLTIAISAADVAAPATVGITVFTAATRGGGESGGATLNIVAPVPNVTALSPASALVGGTAFTLTVTGSGFLTASVVQWNGADRPTTFVSALELRAQITQADLATAGAVPVTVRTPHPRAGLSGPFNFSVENPVPALLSASALSPASVEAGSGAFSLTVRGTGFVPSSTVRWNGAPRVTTFTSPTELVAAITAADVTAASTAQVTVFNAAPGGGESAAASFRIRDRRGAFLLASVSNTDALSDDTSLNPAVSATGRYVAFATDATNLVTGDANGVADVYVRDTCFGASNCTTRTIRVSVTPTGGDGFSHSNFPSLTSDGRYVAFTSDASNLVAGDTNGQTDVFLRDTCIGAAVGCAPSTQLVSVDSAGVIGNDVSELGVVSANGRFVAFRSNATNLVTGDTNGYRDIFVRDTCVGASGCTPSTVRVSVSTAGTQADFESGSERPAINANGRYVAFTSSAANLLAAPDGNARADVFLRDTCFSAPTGCTPSTIRISVSAQGAELNGASTTPGLSADARYVVFESRAPDLVAGDLNGTGDVFVRDTCIGAPSGCTPSVERVSLTTSGGEANGSNYDPVISADGRYVGWTTFAANLMPASFGGVVRDTCRGATECMPSTVHVTIAGPGGTNPPSFWGRLALSDDGRVAAWTADQAGILPNDTNGRRDIFLSFTGL